MQSIDLDVLDFLLLGKLRIYPMALSRLGEKAPSKLLESMRQHANCDMLIVDSFTSAITKQSNDWQLLNFFEECKRLCSGDQTIIITLHPKAVEEELIAPLRSMSDAHLKLRTEQDGQRLVKTLEVAKIRGAASVTGAIVGFDVEPGWGMRVIPISKARG